MKSIEEIVKNSKGSLYGVYRKNCYIETPDGKMTNFGLYHVEEICCCNEDDYNRVISNCSHIYEYDNNVLLTDNEYHAYMKMNILNNMITKDIMDKYFLQEVGIVRGVNIESIEFENFSISKCKDLINKRKADKEIVD